MRLIKHTFLVFSFVVLTLPSVAQASMHEDIAIKVNGMVCDFCAQSVWKVMEDYDGVTHVDIDLDTGLVTVHMEAGKSLSDEKLDEAITYAGYDLVSIERTEVSEPHHPQKEDEGS